MTHGAAPGFGLSDTLFSVSYYTSSTRFLRYQHEQAYLLAKGEVQPPAQAVPDVIEFLYTSNELHPTQNPPVIGQQPSIGGDHRAAPVHVYLDNRCRPNVQMSAPSNLNQTTS